LQQRWRREETDLRERLKGMLGTTDGGGLQESGSLKDLQAFVLMTLLGCDVVSLLKDDG